MLRVDGGGVGGGGGVVGLSAERKVWQSEY